MVNTVALASCLGTPNYKLNLYITDKFDLNPNYCLTRTLTIRSFYLLLIILLLLLL